jgi:hypothetical protein
MFAEVAKALSGFHKRSSPAWFAARYRFMWPSRPGRRRSPMTVSRPGDSLVLPAGYEGTWEMQGNYRELAVVMQKGK